jgi:hypothetical protein
VSVHTSRKQVSANRYGRVRYIWISKRPMCVSVVPLDMDDVGAVDDVSVDWVSEWCMIVNESIP